METTAALNHWKQLGDKASYHGIITPLLALRSEESLGCGEFGDLLQLIDWVGSSGLTIIQLLPLNDTGYDSSPYAALSGFSLNPIYIGLSQAPLTEQEREQLRELNNLERVPYERLRREKLQIMRALFERGWGKEFDLTRLAPPLGERLVRYARFMALKDHFDLKPWWEWPSITPDLEASLEDHRAFYLTLQLIAHEQLESVSAHARKKGVKLAGDLPILLCKDSSEVFFERELFNLDREAGAPPDQYSLDGQNWGFPTYRWSSISDSGYEWWKARLNWSACYFDLYRIDHVAGFFGIWSISPGKKATEGFYDPSNPEIRLELGTARLRALLESSHSLPIGEDLGHIDPRIRERLLHLGIPGMKVMRWHRHWERDGSFVALSEYPSMSMACVSTHDSSTLRQWFDEDREGALQLSSLIGLEHPTSWSPEWSQAVLTACSRANSAIHLNLLVDYFDAFDPLKATVARDYRINVPACVDLDNWTLRYSKSIKKLRAFKPLTQFWKSLCQ